MDTPIRIKQDSSIHGKGAIAARRIHRGELIPSPTEIGWGGFNHSCDPNLGARVEEGVPIRPALRNIREGEELTVSYNRLNGHTVFCNCEVCGGKQVSYSCNCPRHRKRMLLPPALVLGAGLLLSGFLFQLEEVWVDKLQFPKFWKGRK